MNEYNNMNDLEKFTQTLTDLGIKFDKSVNKIPYIIQGPYQDEEYEIDTYIHIDNGIGYSGFYGEFFFRNEKFITHGIWE